MQNLGQVFWNEDLWYFNPLHANGADLYFPCLLKNICLEQKMTSRTAQHKLLVDLLILPLDLAFCASWCTARFAWWKGGTEELLPALCFSFHRGSYWMAPSTSLTGFQNFSLPRYTRCRRKNSFRGLFRHPFTLSPLCKYPFHQSFLLFPLNVSSFPTWIITDFYLTRQIFHMVLTYMGCRIGILKLTSNTTYIS